YDTSGDGVLSEEEMLSVFEALRIPKKNAEALFKAADANEDGQLQVHEFISWLTQQKPKVCCKKNGSNAPGTTIDFTITNPSDRAGKKFTFTFKKCKGMDYPEGNPVTVILQPGEQVEKTFLVVKERPWTYTWSSSSRSHFTGVEDDLSNAFSDAEFGQNEESIGKSSTKFKCSSKCEMWVRARMLGDPSEAMLFDQVRPQDIHQGSVGDCWLMSALSCLAGHPKKLKSLFESKQITEDGKYKIYLFDVVELKWTPVIIDEFLPCKTWNGCPKPIFAEPLGEEIWVALLEKAFAKFCGSYGNLSGGGCAWAFQVLTGEHKVISYAREKDGNWRLRRINRKRQMAKARSPRNAPWTWNRSTPKLDKEQLFTTLQTHIADQHVLACSCSGKSSGAEQALANGLYTFHVYSLLKVLSETCDDGTPVRLVQLRNPWGHKEWTGEWADQPGKDGSEGMKKWEENPELKQRLNPGNRNDGSFFMPFDAWSEIYTHVSLCPVGKAPIPEEEEAAEEEVVSDAGSSDQEAFLSESEAEDGPAPMPL
ncbi:unnamed protein product, partial [Effrenium voratum]